MNNGLNGDPNNENRDYPGITHLLPDVPGISVQSATASVPSTAGLATIAHGFTSEPSIVRVRLRCTTTNLNWAVGDKVEISAFGDTNNSPGFAVYVDDTNVYVKATGASAPYLMDKSSGMVGAITIGSWEILVESIQITPVS